MFVITWVRDKLKLCLLLPKHPEWSLAVKESSVFGQKFRQHLKGTFWSSFVQDGIKLLQQKTGRDIHIDSLYYAVYKHFSLLNTVLKCIKSVFVSCVLFLFHFLFFFTFIAPCRITNTMHPWLYPGKATATTRAALSSPSSVCDVFTVFAFCGAIGSFNSFLALPFLSMRLVCASRGTPVYHASHSHPRARHSCPQTWWQSTVLSPGVLLLCNDQLL